MAEPIAPDPGACGTCVKDAAAGRPPMHDECAQRAVLVQAPDHPHYEAVSEMSREERAALPARFHVPVYEGLGLPKMWLCAVCGDEDTVVMWPCSTADACGEMVFTEAHHVDRQRRQAASDRDRLRDLLTEALHLHAHCEIWAEWQVQAEAALRGDTTKEADHG